MGLFVASSALSLLTLVDARRAFLFAGTEGWAAYIFRSPFLIFSPAHALMLAVGLAGMIAGYRIMKRAESRVGEAELERSLKLFTLAVVILMVVDLFVYRGVPASRILTAGRMDAKWLDAFGVTGWLRPFALSVSYMATVWHATFLGILLGGLGLIVLPRYLAHWFTRTGLGGTVFGAMFALPQPFCSCCASVMAPSYARRGASTQFLLAFVVGAPMLNLTTMILAAGLLPAKYAALRIGAGLVLTLPLTLWVARLADRVSADSSREPGFLLRWTGRLSGAYCKLFHVEDLIEGRDVRSPAGLARNWLRASLRLGLLVVPIFFFWTAFTAGALELAPRDFGNNALSVVGASVLGTLMMVSTWTEIPVAIQLIERGLSGPAAALLVTLPPVSLPCLMILGGAIGKFRVVGLLGGAVAAAGLIAGLVFVSPAFSADQGLASREGVLPLPARERVGVRVSAAEIDESPAIHHHDIAGKREVYREKISPPKAAPDFALTDRDGRVLRLGDLRGKVVIVSFIYSNCPDACPILAAHYLRVQSAFKSALEKGDLALVFVSTDPERDTPSRLQAYTEAMGGRWHFLTGKLSDLEKVWAAYGVHREVKERNKEIVIYHAYRTHLIDPEGRLRILHVGLWSPESVLKDLESLLGRPPA